MMTWVADQHEDSHFFVQIKTKIKDFLFQTFVVGTETYPAAHQRRRTGIDSKCRHFVFEVSTAASKSPLCPCIHAPASGESTRDIT